MRRGPTALLLLALAIAAAIRGPIAAEAYELAYTLPGDPDDYWTYPTFLGDGLLVIGRSDYHDVHVYDASSGALRATLECPRVLPPDPFSDTEHCPVAVAASTILTAVLGDSRLHVFDHSGTLLRTIDAPLRDWERDLAYTRGLAVRGRKVYAGAWSIPDGTERPVGTVFVFDGTTGVIVRRFLNPAPDAVRGFGSRVLLAGRRLFVGAIGGDAYSGSVVAFDVRTTAPIWTREAPDPAPGDAFGSKLAALRDGDVVVGPGAYRLRGRSGDIVQQYRLPDGSPPSDVAAFLGRVAVADRSEDAVHVLDAADGEVLETVAPPDPSRCAPFARRITLARGVLMVMSDGYCGNGRAWVFQAARRRSNSR
jgi:outer membrane protein assembly factor BamB